jgi:hypothetical protein
MGEYFAGRRGFDLLGDETWVKDETTKLRIKNTAELFRDS